MQSTCDGTPEISIRDLVPATELEYMAAIAILVESDIMGEAVRLDSSNDEMASQIRLDGIALGVGKGQDFHIFNAVVLHS